VKQSVREVSKAGQQVDRITSIDVGERTQKVEVKRSGFGELLLDQTQNFLAGAAIMFVLLFFLLASGDHFLRKLITALPRLQDKKRAVEISRRIEHDISSYLVAITLINILFGTAVGLALFFLGMPNPGLWGVMAGFLHFVPFLGAIAGLSIVTLVALLTFDQTTTIVLVPTAYLCLNLLAEYILLPFVISHRLMLNPVIVFSWLTFWAWLWGIPGALMAVPLLVIFKIVCERVQSLSLAAEFLGR
jgi:predicted PurR-regulated permease PerM